MLSPEEIRRISDRTLKEARYIIANKSTLRKTGEKFGVSRTTILNDINRLKNTDYDLYLKVRKIINSNLEMRTLRANIASRKSSKIEFKQHNL